MECKTCNGWNALQCTMCKCTGKVKYKVKNYTLRRGEKATAKSIADAITKNRAELVHFPASMDSDIPLPCKDCPTCDGSCVMACPGCKQKHPLRISEDDIMEPPSQAFDTLKRMHYPYEFLGEIHESVRACRLSKAIAKEIIKLKAKVV